MSAPHTTLRQILGLRNIATADPRHTEPPEAQEAEEEISLTGGLAVLAPVTRPVAGALVLAVAPQEGLVEDEISGGWVDQKDMVRLATPARLRTRATSLEFLASWYGGDRWCATHRSSARIKGRKTIVPLPLWLVPQVPQATLHMDLPLTS